MSMKRNLGLNTLVLMIIIISLTFFWAAPTPASIDENNTPKILHYADIVSQLGFNSGDARADLDSLQASLGIPADGSQDRDTIFLLESIADTLGREKSQRQYQLQKTGSGYQLVIVEAIPVPAADIGSLAQFARPAADNILLAGVEEEPETSALETKMVEMINKERTARGINPLEIDHRLVNTARMKSRDMIENNYFSHDSPTYGTPFDLMKSQKIRYAWAGENLAGAPTLEIAFKNLMNSEGHRKNILHPNFTKVGIGIVEGSKYQMVFTQHFIGY